MGILTFNKFNESRAPERLLYYSMDWDDNILNMPTVIHMEKKEGDSWVPVDVSTSDFAIVRNDKENYRILNNNPDDAFSEFRDSGPRGKNAFLIDIKNAISKGKFGPAWSDFIECLTNGCLFSIITARGHESDTMKNAIEWIIDNVLSDEQQNEMYNNLLKYAYLYREEKEYDRILKGVPSKSPLVQLYLDNCDFVGVSSPSRGGSPANPEKAKEEALLEFKDKVDRFAKSIGVKAEVGFSDDDVKNVKHIENLVDNLSHERFPNIIKFVVKNTKNPEMITKKTRIMSETSHQTHGLESSILPFTQFNNMTNKLYPKGELNRQDDLANKNRREVDYLSKYPKENRPWEDGKPFVRRKKKNKKPLK